MQTVLQIHLFTTEKWLAVQPVATTATATQLVSKGENDERNDSI